MATITKFENLPCWISARALSRRFYCLTISGPLSKDFSLRNQMRKSVISIMSNIAEGFDRNGNREFVQFCYIAKASAAEFRSQLYTTYDIGYLNETDFLKLKSMAEEVSMSIGGLLKYLNNSDFKGSKYQEEEPEYNLSHSLFQLESISDENDNKSNPNLKS